MLSHPLVFISFPKTVQVIFSSRFYIQLLLVCAHFPNTLRDSLVLAFQVTWSVKDLFLIIMALRVAVLQSGPRQQASTRARAYGGRSPAPNQRDGTDVHKSQEWSAFRSVKNMHPCLKTG